MAPLNPEKYPWCKEDSPGIFRITVWVTPNAKKEQVITSETEEALILYVKSPPIEGRANKDAIRLLSKLFEVPKNNIVLVSGDTVRSKVFKIRMKS